MAELTKGGSVRVLGACLCGAEDTIAGLMWDGPLRCSKCKRMWLDYRAQGLYILILKQKLFPVHINATKDEVWLVFFHRVFGEVPNRDFFIYQLVKQFTEVFGLQIEQGSSSEPLAVSGVYLDHFVRFEWTNEGLRMRDRTPVPTSGPPPPSLERNKSKIYPYGNSVSRQLVRWYRHLLKIWCMEAIPGFGRGRILKVFPGSKQAIVRERRRLAQAVGERASRAKFRLFKKSYSLLHMPRS